jgi:hypothetical protein
MNGKNRKHSYAVTCSSAFRDAVLALADRRKVNVADMTRSIVLVLPEEVISAYVDPGEPARDDRETVTIKSGAAAGRLWRRKPRLQVRMAPGLDVTLVRKALGLALALEQGDIRINIDNEKVGVEPKIDDTIKIPTDVNEVTEVISVRNEDALGESDELERLRALVSVLSFDPLDQGITCREEAMHVLGFPPGPAPDTGTLRNRFRMLAAIHHPDSPYGNHKRMSQLNAAMDHLRSGRP